MSFQDSPDVGRAPSPAGAPDSAPVGSPHPGRRPSSQRITALDVQLAWAHNDCIERPSMADLIRQAHIAKQDGDFDRSRLYLRCAQRRLEAIQRRAAQKLYGVASELEGLE